MRRPHRRMASPANILSLVTLLALLSTSHALSFYDFQRIANFPSACTTAYTASISSCTSADFADSSAPCSPACASGVADAARAVNQACAGQSADPSTLIGMIFQGNGVHALCPIVAGSTPGSMSSNSATAASTTFSFQTTTSSSSTSTSSSTLSPTSSSSTSASSKTSISSTTLQLSTTTTPAPNSFTRPAGSNFFSPVVATTAPVAPAATYNPNSFGGDVAISGASSASRLRPASWHLTRWLYFISGLLLAGWI